MSLTSSEKEVYDWEKFRQPPTPPTSHKPERGLPNKENDQGATVKLTDRRAALDGVAMVNGFDLVVSIIHRFVPGRGR